MLARYSLSYCFNYDISICLKDGPAEKKRLIFKHHAHPYRIQSTDLSTAALEKPSITQVFGSQEEHLPCAVHFLPTRLTPSPATCSADRHFLEFQQVAAGLHRQLPGAGTMSTIACRQSSADREIQNTGNRKVHGCRGHPSCFLLNRGCPCNPGTIKASR